MKSNKNTGFIYLALCLASLVSMGSAIATGPVAYLELHNLIVHEDIIYADFDSYYETMFYSTDGKTWVKIDFNHPAETDIKLPTQVIDQISKSAELPVTICLPDNTSVCYQTAKEEILQSQDGGKTWSVSWSIPEGRKKFMERATHPGFNIGPYDLVISSTNNSQIIVAAMGEAGVLVKTNNGPWESVEVNGLGPLPYVTHTFSQLINSIGAETTVINLLAIFYLCILLYIHKRNIGTFSALRGMLRTFGEALTFVLFLSFCTFTVIETSAPYLMSLLFGPESIFSKSLFILTTLLFHQLLTNINKQGQTDFIILLFIWSTSYAVFIYWAYGTIPLYETAFNINIILGIFSLLWFLYTLLKSIFKHKTN